GDIEMRGTGGQAVAVVEADSGRLLGTVNPESACSTVHPGAVYLHRGDSFVVDDLDLDNDIALVHAETPEWTTSPRESTEISILRTEQQQDAGGGVCVHLGDVEVTSQVVGYLRKLPSGEVVDQVALDLPEQTLQTRSVWYTVATEKLLGSAPGGAELQSAHL